jgi:RimJ/RimL family protein N-acetyltransferase
MPLIANCFTLPAHRGRRLYPRLLLCACAELARRGHARVAISCEPRNHASIRGIEKAGFTGVARIRAVIVLLRIVLLRRTESYRTWASRSAQRG